MEKKDTFASRRARVSAWLRERNIAAALFEDREDNRDLSIRYLTGQPGDSLLVVTAAGRGILVAWDVNMARRLGRADEILAYGDFERVAAKALVGVLEREGITPGSVVELPSRTSYPEYIRYVEIGHRYDFLCREEGVSDYVLSMRAVKDADEIAVYGRVAEITNRLIESLERGVRSGGIATETDAALFIERECRALGCEGTGFETLAAGPERSFGIHAFPPYTAGSFGAEGMSILDFGVVLDGYTTDVTMTFVRGNSKARETMIDRVENVYRECAAMIRPGVPSIEISRKADEIFEKAGFRMPHALGHGIGLEAHEAPAMRNRPDNEWVLATGHIVTLEPGLYDPELGGVRLENDFLLTADGSRPLTNSLIVRL